MKKKAKDLKVCFAFTTRGNDLYYSIPGYLLNQQKEFNNQVGCICAVSLWGPSTEQLLEALADAPYEYFHIIDSDVCPALGTTKKLIETGKDICASPVWMYDPATNDTHLNIARSIMRERIHIPGGGLEECRGASFASVVISKRVLTQFKMGDESFTGYSDFVDNIPENLRMIPDIVFYEKAYKFGFPTYMNWSLPAGTHHKYVNVNTPTVINLYNNVSRELAKQHQRASGSRQTPKEQPVAVEC